MKFMQGLFRSFLNSIIITMLFMLVAVSLMVGNFPPSVKQVKNVFEEYKKMLVLKQTVMDQYAGKDASELAEALQKQRQVQLDRLGKARGAIAAAAERELEDGANIPKPKLSEDIEKEKRIAEVLKRSGLPADALANHPEIAALVEKEMALKAQGTQVVQVPTASAPPPAAVSEETKNLLHEMRMEIYRLNQRVQELENRQPRQPAAAAAAGRK